MKFRRVAAVLLASLVIVSAAAAASGGTDLVEANGNGLVNWTRGILQAGGMGTLPENGHDSPQAPARALEAAHADAVDNLRVLAHGVRIDAATTVGDLAGENAPIRTKIQEMVSNAGLVKREYLSDGTVTVVVQMSLYGGFSQLVLPQEIRHVESVLPLSTSGSGASNAAAGASPPEPAGDIFSGLVVDTRGIDFRPALDLKIMDENGHEVYGSAFVSREYAVQTGICGFVRDLAAARRDPRVGTRPLTVRGLSSPAARGADIVISNADAAKLRSASTHLEFLKQCRVMIVVNQ